MAQKLSLELLTPVMDNSKNIDYHGSNGKLRKILIVEDETLVSWSIGNILKKAGHESTIVDSGEKAVELLAKQDFDIVITDLKLPQIDGFVVATTAKTKNPTTPVVMISAMSNQTIQGLQVQQLIDYYLEKPFDLNEIVEISKTLINKSQKRSTNFRL